MREFVLRPSRAFLDSGASIELRRELPRAKFNGSRSTYVDLETGYDELLANRDDVANGTAGRVERKLRYAQDEANTRCHHILRRRSLLSAPANESPPKVSRNALGSGTGPAENWNCETAKVAFVAEPGLLQLTKRLAFQQQTLTRESPTSAPAGTSTVPVLTPESTGPENSCVMPSWFPGTGKCTSSLIGRVNGRIRDECERVGQLEGEGG